MMTRAFQPSEIGKICTAYVGSYGMTGNWQGARIVSAGRYPACKLTMRHPLDFTLVAMTLWLLASMIIDALTPKWLTVYMIGAGLAPLVLAGLALHFQNWRNRRGGKGNPVRLNLFRRSIRRARGGGTPPG
jgi:hypothetical protein